jgi:hypothetical protein
MRVGPQPIIARPAWHDRNPTSKTYYFCADASPHSITERFSYTVPSGKKAMVEVLSCRVERRTAATSPSSVLAAFHFTPSGGTGNYILRAIIYTNNVGDKEHQALGTTLILCTGDTIKAYTYDGSTGGTCEHLLTMKITEFDA